MTNLERMKVRAKNLVVAGQQIPPLEIFRRWIEQALIETWNEGIEEALMKFNSVKAYKRNDEIFKTLLFEKEEIRNWISLLKIPTEVEKGE